VLMLEDPWTPPTVLLAVDLVILTLRASTLQILLVERSIEPFQGALALPGGFLSHDAEDILTAAHRELNEEASLGGSRLHLEQLGTYGTPGRDPRGRVVSVAYLAIAPGLPEPVPGTDAAGAFWRPVERVLTGRTRLAFDHREIVADGVERARAKLEHTGLAAAFCDETFTISELQAVYEAVWGVALDQRNFYRKVQAVPDFLSAADVSRRATGGRPARLFRADQRALLYPPIARPDPSNSEENQLTDDTVVILTALNLEYAAVRARLTDLKPYRHPRGTRFEIGTVPGSRCRVVLGLAARGNQAAAALAERVIEEFSPAAMLFVGVAGALWDGIALGDVVVASKVYAYHGGTSEDDGLMSRPASWEIPHELAQLAAHVERTGEWTAGLPTGALVPAVRFGPIAAGEIVQNSRSSREAKYIRERYNDALAIEMEGAGAAQAGHLSGTAVAVVRGISDMADGTKSSDGDGSWQPRAAANAAAFAVRLAQELIDDRWQAQTLGQGGDGDGTVRGGRRADDSMENEGGARDPRGGANVRTVAFNNHATGQIGFQAGQVNGGTFRIGLGSEPTVPVGLAADLAALRDLLEQQRSAGEIDETTYEAAQEELTTASAALAEAATPEGRNTFVLALKRLRGLIADMTDLATRVAAMLVTAKGL
jgi:nucleoside phosphorylase/ADP-ribose pyrophosphatase YjhB (NUDIX family)